MKKETKQYIPALKYDWLTRFYNPLVRITMPEKEFKTELIKQANIHDSHQVLDFGIGTATLSLLAEENHPNTHFTGVDVDAKVIRIAKKKIENSKAKIKIHKYDGFILPYPDNHFDRVITSLVFHHLDTEQKINSFYEIKRVLKPNGELHIADWGKAKNSVMRFLFLFVQILDGFKTTSENVNGLLPKYIDKCGFSNVKETKQYSTIFGTLSLYKATKNN
jgi:ubiquinone/menaquinone biosynthesis C-methylase UbiE